MDKVRRGLVISMPMVSLLGLHGCGGGDATDEQAQAQERAQMAALGTVGGFGLQVNGTYSATLKKFTTAPDVIFKSGTNLQCIVPDANLVQGCMNQGVLSVALWEGVSNHHRSVSLKLANPAVGKVYDVAQWPAGSALVEVLVAQFDAVAGKGISTHYDYSLNKGQITVTAMSDQLVTLQFTGVVGAPTPTVQVPNNLASRILQLDGSVRVAYRVEDIAWLA